MYEQTHLSYLYREDDLFAILEDRSKSLPLLFVNKYKNPPERTIGLFHRLVSSLVIRKDASSATLLLFKERRTGAISVKDYYIGTDNETVGGIPSAARESSETIKERSSDFFSEEIDREQLVEVLLTHLDHSYAPVFNGPIRSKLNEVFPIGFRDKVIVGFCTFKQETVSGILEKVKMIDNFTEYRDKLILSSYKDYCRSDKNASKKVLSKFQLKKS